MANLVGLSVAGEDIAVAEMLYALLAAEFGERDENGRDQILLYDPNAVAIDVAQDSRAIAACTVLVALISRAYDASSYCIEELLARLQPGPAGARIGLLVLLGDTPTNGLLDVFRKRGGVEKRVHADRCCWDGFLELGQLASAIGGLLRDLSGVETFAMPAHPRKNADPDRALPEAVRRHCPKDDVPKLKPLFEKPVPNTWQQRTRESLHTSALFISHLQQSERAARIYSGLQSLAKLCPTDLGDAEFGGGLAADDRLREYLRPLRRCAIRNVLGHLRQPGEPMGVLRSEVRIRCALLARFRSYLDHHFPHGLPELRAGVVPTQGVDEEALAAFMRCLADIVLPTEWPPDIARFRELITELRIRSSSVARAIRRHFFIEGVAPRGDAHYVEPVTSLVRFKQVHEPRLVRFGDVQ